MPHRVDRLLRSVARDLRPADLLLFRGSGIISKLIGTAGQSEYSHAAKVDRWGDELFCCEMRELKGGRIVTLASQVLKFPGDIDVYHSNPNHLPGYDRAAAAAWMRRCAGTEYSYTAVATAALQHLPGVRLLIDHDYSDEGDTPDAPLFCSQACALSDRFGGFDPVAKLAARFITPGHLEHSTFYRYFCTLTGV